MHILRPGGFRHRCRVCWVMTVAAWSPKPRPLRADHDPPADALGLSMDVVGPVLLVGAMVVPGIGVLTDPSDQT